jgi:hypothetical protein
MNVLPWFALCFLNFVGCYSSSGRTIWIIRSCSQYTNTYTIHIHICCISVLMHKNMNVLPWFALCFLNFVGCYSSSGSDRTVFGYHRWVWERNSHGMFPVPSVRIPPLYFSAHWSWVFLDLLTCILYTSRVRTLCCWLPYSFQVDGLSLLCATLKHWLALNERCPRIFVSTHFHSLIRQKLLPDTPILKYQVGWLSSGNTGLVVISLCWELHTVDMPLIDVIQDEVIFILGRFSKNSAAEKWRRHELAVLSRLEKPMLRQIEDPMPFVASLVLVTTIKTPTLTER